jgi:sugar transferase (PEP-CTERM/EpsH1 system associated)
MKMKSEMKPRVLYVTHRVPWPPDRGDRIRTWNILKFLSSRADVDLACLADEPAPEETIASLRRVTRRLAIVPHQGWSRYVNGLKSLICGGTITEGMFHSPQLKAQLQNWAQSQGWDAALASSSGIAAMTAPSVIGDVRRRWIDLIDVDSEKWYEYSRTARFPKSILYRTEGRRLRAVESGLARDCEKLLVVSEAEVQLFRQFCATDRIVAVANGVDTDYFSRRPSETECHQTCVFVGVMNYLPNVDAVCWFVSEVWPRVRDRYPSAKFQIVGKSPSAEVLALGKTAGVEVIGSVPDVRPWLNRATCAVIPLRIARGIQNKVLEAMACGCPVISSSAPLRGIAAEPGLHLLRADSADEWVNEISRVFQDPCLQQEIGFAAETWVRQHHCWDACLETLNDMTGCPEEKPVGRNHESRIQAEVGQ